MATAYDLMKAVARIEGKLDRLLGASGAGGGSAPESDLDSQYGNEEIKKDPPRWSGQAFAPCNMADASPEYLDCFADFKDYCAENDTQKARAMTGEEAEKKLKYAGYNRKSAARARGWAARKRNGWKPAEKPAVNW